MSRTNVLGTLAALLLGIAMLASLVSAYLRDPRLSPGIRTFENEAPTAATAEASNTALEAPRTPEIKVGLGAAAVKAGEEL